MIDPKDLLIKPYPIRGIGGQQVGTACGVMITHIPTEITAIVCTHRSQFKNRNIAMDMILAALTHKDTKLTESITKLAQNILKVK